MILADTSVWVAHFRSGEASLAALLDANLILAHPFVIGELALGNLGRRLGNLGRREAVLTALLDLPAAVVATDREVLEFIDRAALLYRGSGRSQALPADNPNWRLRSCISLPSSKCS